jgi:uncharacterized protein
MRVQIDEIPPEGLSIEFKEGGSRFFKEEAALRFGDKIVARLQLSRVDQFVQASGRAETAATLQCARCLEEFSFPIDTEFTVEIRPVEKAESHGEVQLLPDDMDVLTYTGADIDILELVAGQVAESLPLKPLCRESCRGLCPQCGQNSNLSECGCVPAESDTRLAKLKELLKDPDS